MSKESSVFFPEKMQHVGLVVPLESAASTIKNLADNDLIHLVDSNSGNNSVNKRYTESYIHCEEAERCIQFIGSQLQQYDLLPPKMEIQQFREQLEQSNVSGADLFKEITYSYESLNERIQRTQQLESQLNLAQHTLAALRFYKPLLHERRMKLGGDSETERSSAFEMELLGGQMFLFSLTGIIETIKLRKLLVTFYRISRGNVVSQTGEFEEKDGYSFFTIWFQTESLERKLSSIAQSYGAEIFEFPQEDANIDKKENDLVQQIFEGKTVLKQSYSDNKTFLLQEKDKYWFNKLFFIREKQMYMYMDFADFTTLEDRAIYRGWVPERRLGELQPLLDRATEESGCPVHTTVEKDTVEDAPPTFIETNDFTAAFQLFNDSYGVANHDEVNGGAFYCMYPFLFGIMFGDVGHAFIYLLVALAIIILTPKLRKLNMGDMFDSVISFRWFILFMAICGMYCGFVYNEFFGLPIDFFGSSYYKLPVTNPTIDKWAKKEGKVYPFGVDPIWMFKDNELTFLNSLKMKLSVIFGISQMIFGMALALIKHVYRKHWSEIFLVWVPQVLYLLSFFGYMVVLIFKKWCTQFPEGSDGVNLIQVLISMLLNCTDQIPADLYLYKHQKIVQNVIALIFVLTIPVLLFGKPIYEIVAGKAKNGIIEVCVMNLIDVIEYCLSALSHTASYLRLWALSLAHSQLSHVLYEQVFMNTLKSHNPVLFFCGWSVYAVGTVVILLGMECFSSLLHAIRLMWVEFSSKFYTGQGYQFEPISFKNEVQKSA